MKHLASPESVSAQDYAALRQTGTQAARARVELGLAEDTAQGMERLLQVRTARGAGDRQLPKFARHDRHVASVMAAGGFWAFSERRIGKHMMAVCLPLIPPGPSPTGSGR
jgi:hypothetical protein